jgi:hypothetical protein
MHRMMAIPTGGTCSPTPTICITISWTAGQRNDFQVATLAAYWASDTDRHDEASLDRAVGKAVDDAVDDLMSVYSLSPFEIAIGDQASSAPHAGLTDTHDFDRS